MSAAEILAADAYGLTADRLIATTAALATLAGVVAGILAMVRPAGSLKPGIALATGLAGTITGILVVALADGGPGTGNGIVGGWAAIVFGLSSATLGALALLRRRRGFLDGGVDHVGADVRGRSS
ncbi:hypothetical protein Ade02nite_52740 [Paractinoplanes deccanensis]|uniref:Uncharacterized protein n=1 Tax=Paractinoplanes deccanensis TaxID=113561 RepID=A0ABQ3Y9F0_9ACTN|nr:DUF6223 family protein [Actinoplanes deccanensis]GID76633.1 hypothetical protein Ade02nite_52740 [Actinoplanes deccanensis]